MGRTDLAPDEGMLFVFPRATTTAFWMKDTPLSLDIIHLDHDGTVLQINDHTVPYSTELIIPTQAFFYTPELLAGTRARIALQVGDRVTLPEHSLQD